MFVSDRHLPVEALLDEPSERRNGLMGWLPCCVGECERFACVNEGFIARTFGNASDELGDIGDLTLVIALVYQSGDLCQVVIIGDRIGGDVFVLQDPEASGAMIGGHVGENGFLKLGDAFDGLGQKAVRTSRQNFLLHSVVA